MDKGAGEGEIPEVSPELTRLRTIVEMCDKDASEAFMKLEAVRKKYIRRFDELKAKGASPAEVLSVMTDMGRELQPLEDRMEEAQEKWGTAFKELLDLEIKSLLGKGSRKTETAKETSD